MFSLALAALGGMVGGTRLAYADGGVPGGNITDPVVRAVDIAKPSIVRIITVVVGKLSVTLPNGQQVTFPTTPQNGVNGYPLALSGTGAFISARGDVLTADHVVNPVQDDKAGLDQGLQQLAAQDIASYINRNLNPAQPVTPDVVAQELASGQLPSTSRYQQQQSRVYLSTDFSGPLTATTFNNIPPSQYAVVDQIKQHSPFSALDTAIIHVNGMDNMPMLQLGDSSAVQPQDTLKIIGFPGNGDVSNKPTELLTSSINQVLVSSIKTTDSGAPLIQVGGNVEQGDSGGPALDSNGNVVGIVSFGSVSGGSTSFLRTSNGAKPLIQAAGISTTPSTFQQLWSKAFTDYAAKSAGHWHAAKQEFQQVANQFPQFKALSPFLQYATTQAQSEPQTSQPTTTSPGANIDIGGFNPLWLAIGGIALLCVFLFGGLALSRRRKPAVAASSPSAPGQYGTLPAQNWPGTVPQTPPITSGTVPQTPSYSQPATYQQPAAYGQQGYQYPPATPRPAQPQIRQPQPAPQAPGMAAFGAPSSATPQPDASDNTLVTPRAGSSSVASAQWLTWPCGHTNRFDARFCGICGESARPASGPPRSQP